MPQPRNHQVGIAELLLADRGLYHLRIAAAENLLDEGARLVDETGRRPLRRGKLLLAVQATRATHIFESVIVLCRIGRGVPASMLNRALLEEVLDVHWVAANPESAPSRADEHDRLIQLGERAMDERFDRAETLLSPSERREFAVLCERFRGFQASWTLTSHSERLGLVKERWGDQATRNLDIFFEVNQRQNNTLLHPSPTGYGLAMGPGRRQINRVGPDARWAQALADGVLGFYMICRVIAEEFAFDKQVAAERFFFASCVLRDLQPEQLADLADDAPCPCRSGRTLGSCHAS